MSSGVTLDEVERLASQLPTSEQLKLVAHICGLLSDSPPTAANQSGARQGRLAAVEVWLADCDAVAAAIDGEFDASEDLQQIREERSDRS